MKWGDLPEVEMENRILVIDDIKHIAIIDSGHCKILEASLSLQILLYCLMITDLALWRFP